MSQNSRIIDVPFRREDGKPQLHDWTIAAIQRELAHHGLPNSRSIIYEYFRVLRRHSFLFRDAEEKQKQRTGNKKRLQVRCLFQVWALITFAYWVNKGFTHLDTRHQRIDAAIAKLKTEELPTSAFFKEFPDYDPGSGADDFLKVA